MNDIALSSPGAKRYALALEAINEAVYDYDPTTGTIITRRNLARCRAGIRPAAHGRGLDQPHPSR